METRSGSMQRLGSALLVLTLVTPLFAETQDDDSAGINLELGIQGGMFSPDDALTGKSSTLREFEAIGGVRFGWFFARQFGLFADATYSDINSPAILPGPVQVGDVDTVGLRVGVEFLTKPHFKNLQWFLGLGGGVIDYDIPNLTDFDRNFFSASLGQRVALDHRAHFRWELRVDQIPDDGDVFTGQDFTQANAILSLMWGLGRADSDGDGVQNGKDDCPDTPRGAIVDEHGCPKDTDDDGVSDGIDRCPDTPHGALVDEWGCPRDSDGDEVYDGIDRCPDTPKGASVDRWGCPYDSDDDGVLDGIDRCPDTPRGALVDEWGCPRVSKSVSDSDGDGVHDGIDKCPGTPKGTRVGPDGCPEAEELFPDERKTLILEGVFFEFDRAVLTPGSSEILDRVARSLHDWPAIRIEIGGHTDWIGSDEYNLDLSNRRAAAVRTYLIGKGIDPDRMTSRGYGETLPIAPNQSEGGRSKNRRVELTKLE